MAFRIAARAGIAVPVPGAADPAARFQSLYRQAEPVAQAVELVETREPGADDQRVELGRPAGLCQSNEPSCRVAFYRPARTRRPGRAPVSSPFSKTGVPATSVAR